MGKKQKLMVLCSVVLFMTSIAGADTYTMIFNTSDSPFTPGVKNQGWWSNERDNYDENINYGTGMSPTGEVRSFFTYDLSSLYLTVIDAKLELRRYDYASSVSSETLGLFDVSTGANTLNYNVGTSIDIFEDLGSGLCYGEYEVFNTGSSEDIISIQLNDFAIDDINNAMGGWFSIGCSLLTIDGTTVGSGTESIFGNSHIDGEPQRLVLEIIPEPASLLMMSFGLFLFVKQRSGRRSFVG